MPYLGNELATQFQAFVTQTITGDGSTGYTLDRAVANGKELLVYINNVKQEEGSGKAYTASGTTITFSEAVASGDSCYVVFLGSAVQTVVPPDASIVSGMIANANLEMPNTLDMNGKELILDADADTSITADTDDRVDIKVGGSDKVHIASTGLGVGTNAPTDTAGFGIALDVSSSSGAAVYVRDSDGSKTGHFGQFNEQTSIVSRQDDGNIAFYTGASPSEAMRVHSDGDVTIGKTSADNTTAGFTSYGTLGISVVRSGAVPVIVNRLSNDGQLISLRQAGTTEGFISVSGTTVSLSGFSGTHESSGIPTNTPLGTVVSTIDELDVYPLKQGEAGEEEDCPKAGQTRADHPKVKISDTAGDSAVYGVVGSFTAQDKVMVTSVGTGSVRVTGACAKGDLLESNGDGTAKVQSDDIVRSKTIGKVTIGNSNTGVKLVSCVLYCG